MRFSLNQLKERINEFSNSHAQLNSFGFGEIDNINISGNTSYPHLYATLEPSNIQGRYTNINLALLFIDKAEANNNDITTEIQSDMLQVANDCFTWLSHPNNRDNFEVQQNAPITFFTHEFTDVIAGCQLNLSFLILNSNNLCAIPTRS
jgi:hypothetical protein